MKPVLTFSKRIWRYPKLWQKTNQGITEALAPRLRCRKYMGKELINALRRYRPSKPYLTGKPRGDKEPY